jgi:hypothetical protein
MFKSVKFGLLCVYAATSLVTAFGQQGSMHGGQQPIGGARMYMLSPAQSTTPGTASVSLLTSGDGSDQIGFYVISDSNGDYHFSNYSCPSANAPVYFYGSGGDTGYGTNAAISQVVYVGPCGTLSQAFAYMDEVTTVAMAYAVAGYATDPVHISYSGSQASLTGIENAFANANNLASSDSEFGSAYPTIPSGNAYAPQQTVNSIADALAACINQTSGGTYCSTLFSAAPVNGNGVAPTDVAAAVMNIAHNPANSTPPGIQNGTNIAAIMALIPDGYEPYTPVLTSAPNDLTLGLTFYGGSIAYPTALAIDGSGNVWIASQTSSSMPNGSVVEIANPAAMLANNQTYPVVYPPQAEPDSIAVDAASQNIWIGTDKAVEEFSNTGVPASGSPFLTSDPNFVGPGFALNLDTAGNVWIAGNSTVYEVSPSGSLLSSPSGYTLPAGANAGPSALALDASNNVWVADYYNNALVELNSQGSSSNNIGPTYNPDPLNAPIGVAIDANKDVWMANNGNNNDVEYIPNQQIPLVYFSPDTPSPTSNGNPPMLTFVAIDGAGSSWASLENAACTSSSVCLGVAETSGAGKQLSGPGYSIGSDGGGDATANATAIDGSGNVWVLNKYAQSVTELVGAAAPVVTPLALAVSSNSLGVRP